MQARMWRLGVLGLVLFAAACGGEDGPRLSDLVEEPGPDQAPEEATAPNQNTAATERRWAFVRGGDDHTCALTTDGDLYCWGANGGGALGLGAASNVFAPESVTAVDPDSAVSEGDTGDDGGDDEPAAPGCAGGNCLSPQHGGDHSALGTVTSWTGVDAGVRNTCAISNLDTLWCWGDNSVGTVGTGDMDQDENRPALVARDDHWLAVELGHDFACGLHTDGRPFCWGSNAFAIVDGDQLDGPESCGGTPCATVPVERDGLGLLDGLAVGTHHACAVRRSGAMWCWGRNATGELGDGSAGGPDTCTADDIPCAWDPVRVGDANDWRSPAAGDGFSCGLRGEGTLWCWGRNELGQLGVTSAVSPDVCSVGGTDVPCALEPVQVGGSADWISVRVGGDHGCARRSDDRLFCWGNNAAGQLGVEVQERCTDADLPCSPEPVELPAIDGAWTSGGDGGSAHGCWPTTGGDLYCMGSNATGQLGLGGNSGPETCTVDGNDIACSLSPELVGGGEDG